MIGAAHCRRLGLVAVLALMGGCVSPVEREIESGGTFVLSPGESAGLADGTRVRYLRVSSDSRCRPHVQCVWAGRAEIQLRITPASRIDGAESATGELLLSTDLDSSATYSGWRYRLIRLGFEAQPVATLQVERSNSSY